MSPHGSSAGEIVLLLRKEKGLTQEQVAAGAGIDRRTVQRLEKGHRIKGENLQAIAKILGVDPICLYGPRGVAELVELAEEMTCRHCGAQLVERGSVDYQGYDVDCEVFACGASDSLQFRPCPKDPRFPEFSDYELEYHDEGDMIFYARGKTDMARAVHFSHGFGRTKQSAAKWLERSYVSVRYGHDAAEAFYPMVDHR